VDTYKTEEEQVEALRRWWDENGRSTLLAVAAALALGFGWQGWQEYQQKQSEAASVLYADMIEASRAAADETGLATQKHLAEQLIAGYPGTTYAQFAALHLARLSVAENDLEAAEQRLRAVLTDSPGDEIRLVAQLRLARVVAARGNPQGGLDILAATEAGAFEPAFAEAEGDMHQMLGSTDEAIAAYERAVTLSAASGSGASETLQLKLSALTPMPARESAPTAAE